MERQKRSEEAIALSPRATLTLASAIIATLVVGPLAISPGVPAFQHDWIWPAFREQCSAYALQGMTPWIPGGIGGAAIYPQPWAPYLLGGFLCFSTGPHLSVVLFLWILTLLAGMTIAGFVGTVGVDSVQWQCLAAALYVGSPTLLNEIHAGHVFFVWSFALLPLVGTLAFRSKDAPSAFVAGITIAMASAQQQFFFYSIALLIAGNALSNTKRPALTIIAIGTAITAVSPQWILLAVHGAGSTFAGQRPLEHWVASQSAPLLEAVRHLGYIGGYDRRLPVISAGLLFINASLLIIALIAPKVPRTIRIMSAVALVMDLTYSGSYGPLSWVISGIFHAYAPSAVFRELYNATGLSTCCGVLSIVWLLNRMMKPFRTAAFVLAVTLGLNGLVVAAFASASLPTYAPNASETALAANLASTKIPIRFLTVPSLLPQSRSLQDDSAGFPPWFLPFGEAVNAQSPMAPFPLVAASYASTTTGARGEAILRRAGIDRVILLPRVVYRPALEPALARYERVQVPSARFGTRAIVGANLFSVEPFSTGVATIATIHEGARDIGPFRSGATALNLFRTSGYDPDASWVPASLFPQFPAWVARAPSAIVTMQRSATVPLDIPSRLLIGATSTPKSNGCRQVARVDSHFVILDCAPHALLAGTPPFSISSAVSAGSAIIPSSRLQGRPGRVQVTFALPWMDSLAVHARAGSALVARMQYDDNWACLGCSDTSHRRVDGYANAWVLRKDLNGPVTLFFEPAIPYFIALGISVCLTIGGALTAINGSLRRRRQEAR